MSAELFHPGINEIAGTYFLACSRHGSLWHALFDRGASRIDHDVTVIAG